MKNRILNSTLIEDFELKGWVRNTLNRNNIHTVGELLELSDSDIQNMKKTGANTIAEIISLRDSIASGSVECPLKNHRTIFDAINADGIQEPFAEVMFTDENGLFNRDMPVTVLDITDAKKGALMRNGIDSLRNLAFQEEIFVKNIKSIGKAYDTIVDKLREKMIIFYPANQTYQTADVVANWIGEEFAHYPEGVEQIKNAIRARVYYYEGSIACNSYDELLEDRALIVHIYRDDLVKRLIEDYIVNMIGNDTYSYFELRKMMPESIISSCRLDDILFEMKRTNQIEETEEGYQKYLPYLVDWINTGLTKDREKDVIRKRISGMVLEDIGREYSITRERVRQIEAKAKKKFVRFQEERFVYWYKEYNFTKKQFCEVFGLLPASYDSVVYLAGDSLSDLNKRKPIVEALNDDRFTPSMVKRFRRVLTDQYVYLNDEYVLIKQKNILEKIMHWKHSEEPVRIEDLIAEYNDVIAEYSLKLEPISADADRSLEGIISRNLNVIKREKRQYRYYRFEDYDFEELFARINFKEFMDSEISVKKIMVMYPELMEDYDIRASYELHFIFQCYKDIAEKYGVTVNNVPNIIVGSASRELQVKSFLYKVAPITIDDFAKAYEEEYGVEAPTFMGTYGEFFNDYVKAGRIIDVSQEAMRDDEIFAMKNALSKDLYFLEDIEGIYKSLFPDGNVEKINHYNLKKIGFNVNSTYMFRNTYSSAEDCIADIIMNNNGIRPNEIDRRMYTIQFYYMAKDRLRSSFDILEMPNDVFITFKDFQKTHPSITKEDLADYSNKALNYSARDVFTVHTLRQDGFVHKLDELRAPEIFYAGLIRSKRSGYYAKTLGDYVFSKSNKNFIKEDFLKAVLLEFNSSTINITVLTDYIIEKYGVFFDRYHIPAFVRKLGYYYLADTETIYLNMDEYISALNQ